METKKRIWRQAQYYWSKGELKGQLISYPNYLVSNLGEIKHIKHDKCLKPLNRDRYVSVYLFTPELKKYKELFIHRLIASTFIPNPDNKTDVDHINGNREDNSAENLRWVSHSENCLNPNTNYKLHKPRKQTNQSNETH